MWAPGAITVSPMPEAGATGFRGELRALRLGAGRSFVVKALGAVFALGAQILLARLLGVSEFGVYVYALTWMNVLGQLSRMGLDSSLVKLVAAYRSEERWSELRGFLSFATAAGIGASLLASLLLLVLAQPAVGLVPEEARPVARIAALALPLFALTGLFQAVLRGLKLVGRMGVPLQLVRPATLALVALAWFLAKGGLGARQAFLANLAATAVALALALRWALGAVPVSTWSAAPRFRVSEWLRLSLPLLLVAGMHLLLGQLDILMLANLRGTEAAGPYAAAARLANLVVFAMAAVNTIAAPMISEVHARGDTAGLQRIVTHASRSSFYASLAIATGLTLAGPWILRIYGEGFAVALAPLLVLTWTQVFATVVGCVGILMTMTGHQGQAAWILLLTVALNVAMNALLIPRHGAVGAAWATTASVVLWRLSMLLYVRSRIGVNPMPFRPRRPHPPRHG